MARPLWLAASTHEGEEALALEAHAELRRARPSLLLVIAPRHPRRAAEVCAAAAAAGFGVAQRSAGERPAAATGVYVSDTLGELPALYALSGVALVGGSFLDATLGGHNLLEAARAPGGCAVVHGPHVSAVGAAAAALAATHPPAARLAHDAGAVAAAVGALLDDPAALGAARRAGSAAAQQLESGVLERTWTLLRRPLDLPPRPNLG